MKLLLSKYHEYFWRGRPPTVLLENEIWYRNIFDCTCSFIFSFFVFFNWEVYPFWTLVTRGYCVPKWMTRDIHREINQLHELQSLPDKVAFRDCLTNSKISVLQHPLVTFQRLSGNMPIVFTFSQMTVPCNKPYHLSYTVTV